jgi:hypothetical protein
VSSTLLLCVVLSGAVLIHGRRDVQEQEELLESRAVKDLLLQLGRCCAKLTEDGSKGRDGAGLPALLQTPLRWVGIVGGWRGAREERGEPAQEV